MRTRQPAPPEHGGEGEYEDGPVDHGGEYERCGEGASGGECGFRGLSAGRGLLQPDRGSRQTVYRGPEPRPGVVGDQEGRGGDGYRYLETRGVLDWADGAG